MKNTRKIVVNTGIMYLNMLLTIIISLYTSRVILQALGVNDFGIYNVVAGFVAMFGILNGAMASSVGRSFTCKMGEGNIGGLKKTFNAALVIHFFLSIFVVVVASSIGQWAFAEFINIQPDRIEAALWVYHFAVFAFAVNIISVPFQGLLEANENMLAIALIELLRTILKLIIALVIIDVTVDKLTLYSGLFLGVVVLMFICYVLICMVKHKESHIVLVFDKSIYKELTNFAGWSLFGSVANLGRVQGLAIVLNIFFGTVVNAAYGIANQIQQQLENLSMMLMRASNPQIVKLYASGEKLESQRLVFQIAKVSFGMQYIFAIPFLLEIDVILKIWLGLVPEHSALFCQLMVVNNLIRSLGASLYTYVFASGKIHLYLMSSSFFQLLNLPIAYLLLTNGMPAYSVFIGSISITILNAFIIQFVVKKQIGFASMKFVFDVYLKVLIFVAISYGAFSLINGILQPTFVKYGVNFGIAPIASGFLFYLLVLNRDERKNVNDVANRFLGIISRITGIGVKNG